MQNLARSYLPHAAASAAHAYTLTVEVPREVSGEGFSLRSVLPTLVFDALLPYLIFRLARGFEPGMSEVGALVASALGPAAYGLYEIGHKRRIDIIGAVVLIGMVITVLASFVGGSAKVILIRESFVTGALGLVCLLSLLWARPLMFYVGRQFTVGQDTVEIEKFNMLWRRPDARRVFRFLTVIWGLAWVGEFFLRVVLVQMLSVAQALVIGPIVLNAITLGLIIWTIAWTRHRRSLGAKADAEAAAKSSSDIDTSSSAGIRS